MLGPVSRTLATAAGIVVLGVLARVSLGQGWADLLTYQARTTLNAWTAEDPPPLPAARDLAQERLEQAQASDPRNPAIAEDLGRLHELRTLGAPGTDPVAAAELRESLAYFERSLALRPTSPYTWASIAFVKSRLGVLDAGFLRAIERAAQLGPWEPEVQMTLADIGFRYWDQLPAASRETIHAAMYRALKRQDEKLFSLATRYRRLDVLCTTPGVTRSRRALACI